MLCNSIHCTLISEMKRPLDNTSIHGVLISYHSWDNTSIHGVLISYHSWEIYIDAFQCLPTPANWKCVCTLAAKHVILNDIEWKQQTNLMLSPAIWQLTL